MSKNLDIKTLREVRDFLGSISSNGDDAERIKRQIIMYYDIHFPCKPIEKFQWVYKVSQSDYQSDYKHRTREAALEIYGDDLVGPVPFSRIEE